jgi:hypothetical protein
MKKIILSTILLITLSASLNAGIYGRIEGGKDIDASQIYFTQINIGYKFDLFGFTSRTFGGWMTFMENNNPFSNTYTIGQSIHYRGFFVEANHYCNHRVVSTTHKNNNNLYKSYKSNPQAMTVIKIGYEWEIK